MLAGIYSFNDYGYSLLFCISVRVRSNTTWCPNEEDCALIFYMELQYKVSHGNKDELCVYEIWGSNADYS
jgi:hypothetical protein